ncbi:MAG: efflux RND transporter periplasmic adaptor subunit [Alphaproteobacteria bacterium]|nr:efflux RND transporter periplasmic adaptor subunit [Alphaproteobacteria bacterium]
MTETGAPSRSDLLDRLKLDRTAPDASGGGNGWIPGAGGLVLGLVLAGGAAFLMWPETASAPATSATTSTSAAAPATSGPAPAPAVGGSVLAASGYVTARRLATVSAEVTGKVAEILVEEGTPVTAGQVVARLDATLAQIDLAQAKADAAAALAARDAAIADRENAEATLKRIQGLPRGSVASEADLTRAIAGAEAARARVAQAVATLGAAEANAARAQAMLEKTEIRAPFDGIVTSKDAQPGEIVSPVAAGGGSTRTGICTVVDMTSIEVEVDVSESYISRVKPGQRAVATLDAYPDWRIPASVIAIIPTASRDKATVKVRVALEDKDGRVLPDMAAKVNFMDAGS